MKIPNIKKIIKGKLDTKNEHKYVNHKIHCPNKKIFLPILILIMMEMVIYL